MCEINRHRLPTWTWLAITLGLLCVPIIIIIVCFGISACPFYKYGRNPGNIFDNYHNTGSKYHAKIFFAIIETFEKL